MSTCIMDWPVPFGQMSYSCVVMCEAPPISSLRLDVTIIGY